MTIGNSTRMRIVAEETTDTSSIQPCGSYGNGETQDYTVTFIALTNDVSVSAVVDPLPGSCQTDTQRVSIRIKNAGTASQVNVPISLKVISGNSTLVEITTVYPDTVPALSSAIYTFQTAYAPTAGATYIVQSGTDLPGDQNPANDMISDTLSVSSGSETITGNAEICSTSTPLAGLKANLTDSTDAVLWFDSPASVAPIASGYQATTTDIPSNKTYYLGS